ncbi:hypothetical protein ACROYT_G023382 [Oculina patagonica]
MMVIFSVIFFLVFFRQALAGESCIDHRSQHGFALLDHEYRSFTADRLSACYIACNMQPACQSLNYDLADKTCQFNNNTKYFRPKYFVERATSVYADNPDSGLASWRKLNKAPVCFGAKDNQFGRFEIETGATVLALKLVHLSGSVTCNVNSGAGVWSRFGCWKARDLILTVITNSDDVILLPESQESRYTLPGHYADSKEIVFEKISTPLLLSPGQELRIWYGEDLRGRGEGDNGGTSCVDVYAKYM